MNPVSAPAHEAEVGRVMQICNACRYCEGFCAVFPAMTRRLEFDRADIHYLANLCHNCGACLHACQYAPPHEFAVVVPQALARVRAETYAAYSWPRSLGVLYCNNGLVVALSLALGLGLFLVLKALRAVGGAGGDFYQVFPHDLLVHLFAPVFLFALLALGIGVRRFWRGQSVAPVTLASATEAAGHVLSLKYLDGGHGDGCNNEDDAFSLKRRRFHHFTFYGFLLCLAATSLATLYHFVWHWSAPYPWHSLPVLLGIAGGLGLLIGPAGLLWLRYRRHPLQGDREQAGMDFGFIALLLLTSLTGFALLLLRATGAMPILLALHLGVVMALFLTMPYGKFAHGIYRAAALLKWAVERRQPSCLKLADD